MWARIVYPSNCTLHFNCFTLGLVKSTHLLLVMFVLSGCAWGYAGKEKVQSSPPPEPESNVEIVKVVKKPEKAEEPAPPTSPCGVDSFQIFRFNTEQITNKTIDCNAKSVTDTSSASLAQPASSMVSAGYPQDRWYFVVDPKGEETAAINNTVLLKLSQEYDVEFYGRDASTGLLVYLFLDTSIN